VKMLASDWVTKGPVIIGSEVETDNGPEEAVGGGKVKAEELKV